MDADNYLGTTPTDQQLSDLLYEGVKAVAPQLKLFSPVITLALTGDDSFGVFDIEDTAVVSLPVIRPSAVVIYDGTNTNYLVDRVGRPGLWSYDEFRAHQPSWRNTAAGQPTYAVRYGSKLLLFKRPDATWEAYTAYIEGTYRPKAFTYANDSAVQLSVKGIPEEAQWACCYCAAAIASGIVATHDEAWARLKYFYGKCAEAVEEVGRRNADALAGTCHTAVYEDVLEL